MHDPEPAMPRAPEWPLVAVRLYLGIVFAVAGVGQLLGAQPWGRPADWPKSLQQYLEAFGGKPAPFYAGFLQSVLIAHKDFVAVLLPSIHLVIGVALVLGVGTRFTTAVALFLLVNYMALTGAMPYHPDPISALAALMLAVWLANPKLWRGAQVFARRRPTWGHS